MMLKAQPSIQTQRCLQSNHGCFIFWTKHFTPNNQLFDWKLFD